MNSRRKIFSFLILFAIAILAGSCKKDSVLNPLNASNCDKLAQDISNALNAYVENPSVATCEAYKSALESYVNGCAAYAGYNAAWSAAIDDLDCSDEGN